MWIAHLLFTDSSIGTIISTGAHTISQSEVMLSLRASHCV